MPYSDDKFGTIWPVRSGTPFGTANERQMLDAIGGSEGFRTRIRTMPDGSEVRLRTKNGMPQFETSDGHGKVPINWRLYHGLFRVRGTPLANVDLPSGLTQVMSNKGTLDLTDWYVTSVDSVINAVIEPHIGSTYYSEFPLVKAQKFSKVPSIGAYTICSQPGGPFTIDSTTLVDPHDPYYRVTTTNKTNNVDFVDYERSTPAGPYVPFRWWPWKDTASGIVWWFAAEVTQGSSTCTVKIYRGEADGTDTLLLTTSFTNLQVYGADNEDQYQYTEYNGMPEHSPSGSKALLLGYRTLGDLGGDTASIFTNFLLNFALLVTIENVNTVDVSVFKSMDQLAPVMEVSETVTGDNHMPDMHLYGTYNWSSQYSDTPGVSQYSRLEGSVTAQWVCRNTPGGRDHHEKIKRTIAFFFPGTEDPVEVYFTAEQFYSGHYTVAINGAVSGTGLYVFTWPPGSDSTTFSRSGTAGYRWEYNESYRTHYEVICGAQTWTADGPHWTHKVVKDYTYTPTGGPSIPYGEAGTNSSGTVNDNTGGLIFTAAINEVSDTRDDQLGMEMTWVTMATNNVVRASKAVRDRPETEAATFITARGQFASDPAKPYVSWNPKHDTLATGSTYVQWV